MIIDFLYSLNIFEAFLLFSLFFSCILQLFNSYLDNKWIDIFKPANLFSLLTLFYCVVGPVITSGKSNVSMIYRLIEHRDYYQIGLLAAFLSYLSFQIGFNFKDNFLIKKFGSNKIKEYLVEKKYYLTLFRWGEVTFLSVLFLQFLAFGLNFINRIRFIGSFNLSEGSALGGGVAALYAGVTVNFLIVSILLMYISLLNGCREKFKFIFYLIITISMFINFGFRWRLFMLFLPIFLLYFFYKKTKPKISFLLAGLVSILFFFGLIQFTRTYTKGLNLNNDRIRLIRKSNESVIGYAIKSSFYDSNVFNTSAGMIYKTPSEYDYVGIAPIINAISVPIPRQIWPNKPAGEYLQDLYKKIYRYKKWEVGSASLGFAEYYISGGWIPLLMVNFLLGYGYKRLWIWFLYNFNDPLAQINYAISLSFLFILYSRGYLLQIVFLFITIFTPFFICSYFWNKRIEK